MHASLQPLPGSKVTLLTKQLREADAHKTCHIMAVQVIVLHSLNLQQAAPLL